MNDEDKQKKFLQRVDNEISAAIGKIIEQAHAEPDINFQQTDDAHKESLKKSYKIITSEGYDSKNASSLSGIVQMNLSSMVIGVNNAIESFYKEQKTKEEIALLKEDFWKKLTEQESSIDSLTPELKKLAEETTIYTNKFDKILEHIQKDPKNILKIYKLREMISQEVRDQNIKPSTSLSPLSIDIVSHLMDDPNINDKLNNPDYEKSLRKGISGLIKDFVEQNDKNQNVINYSKEKDSEKLEEKIEHLKTKVDIFSNILESRDFSKHAQEKILATLSKVSDRFSTQELKDNKDKITEFFKEKLNNNRKLQKSRISFHSMLKFSSSILENSITPKGITIPQKYLDDLEVKFKKQNFQTGAEQGQQNNTARKPSTMADALRNTQGQGVISSTVRPEASARGQSTGPSIGQNEGRSF